MAKRSEASAFWKEKGKAFIREQPLAWMRLLWRKFENFWNAFQYDDLSILKLLRDEHATPPGLRFGFAAALGLPGLLLCWRKWPRSRWVAGAVLLHMAALMPVFITERYRLAAAPGLLLLAAGGLWLLWENLASRSWDKVALQVSLMAVCAWFVSQPQRDIGLWSLDFYKAGIRATDGAEAAIGAAKAAGKENHEDEAARLLAARNAYLASALRNLETARAYVPDNAEINFALGNVWFHRHDFVRAKACYGEALRLTIQSSRPHDGALRNMGIIALEEKRWGDAEKFLGGALKIDPDSAKGHFLLARARRESGNIPGALTAVEEAIRLDGTNGDFQRLRDELRKPSPPSAPE